MSANYDADHASRHITTGSEANDLLARLHTVDEATVFDIRAAAVEADGRMIITVNVVDTSESDENFLAYRGPDAVTVFAVYEGQPVGSDSYQPTYDRTDHRGPPSCGYCDEHVEPERLDIVTGP